MFPPQQQQPNQEEEEHTTRRTQLPSEKAGAGILIRILKEGTYANKKDLSSLPFRVVPQNGDTVKIHYEAYLYKNNGTNNSSNVIEDRPFDSSRKRDVPFCFVVGKEEVIDGLNYAVQNMVLGQTVEVIIPYLYGYGENGYLPQVPPQSTLVFHVELLDFTSGDVTDREWKKI